MTTFVDRAPLHASGGNGGNGCASIHREKFKPLGGPDGGNGGDGGDVVLVVDPQVTTLLDFHHSPHRNATAGKQGQGGNRNGAAGRDLVLAVPDGTVVKDLAGEVVVDLLGAGTQFVAAAGGKGGLGNAALASKRRRAPGFALLGEPGQRNEFILELKTVADVALVGFPSAGKSSLIAALSAARPKIADYPFTTLVPNLGVVDAGEVRFTVADVPGLIEGASTGRGLGLEFLRHIERCHLLVHVLDCATLEPGRDPISDLDVILAELAAYPVEPGTTPLLERPALVVLNKVDVPEARELADLVQPDLQDRGLRSFQVSAASHEGLRPLIYAMAAEVSKARLEAPPPAPTRIVLRPTPVNERAFTVRRESGPDGDRFRVLGDKPERWVRQTDFSNDEAVGFLADRLARLGVEDALVDAGAVAGDEVVVGNADAVVFDWEPTIITSSGVIAAPRGGDLRLEHQGRATRAERREAYMARMDGKADARAELADERVAGLWTDPELADDPHDLDPDDLDAGFGAELDGGLDSGLDGVSGAEAEGVDQAEQDRA